MEGLNLYEYCGYTHYYCEENTYRFLEKLVLEPPTPSPESGERRQYEAYAAFITSYSAVPGSEVEPGEWSTAVPIVCGPKPNDVIYWDYHCVAIVKETTHRKGSDNPTTTWWVVDYDTKLGKLGYVAPVHYEVYWGITLSSAAKNAVALIEVRVRVIPAVDFLTVFRSDRRHMYLRSITKDGRFKTMTAKELAKPSNYQHPPPLKPRIQFASPAAGVLKGSWNREQGKAMLEKIVTAPATEWRNEHLNNISSMLNTQNTTVCQGELLTVRELGSWMKRH